MAALAAVLVMGVVLYQLGNDPASLALVSGTVAGAALVLAAALVNLARAARVGEDLWRLVALLSTLAAVQIVPTTLGLVGDQGAEPLTTWAMEVNVAVLVAAVGLSLLLPTLEYRPPPLMVGTALGLTAAVVLVWSPLAVIDGSLVPRTLLSVSLWFGYALVAAVMYRHWPWSELTRTAMTLAVLCLGLAEATRGLADTAVWVAVAGAVVQLVAAGLLTGATYAVVRTDLLAHRRHIHALRERLLAAEAHGRRDRSQQHRMRNLVAGITMAADLLEHDGLDEPVRRRLEHRLHVEAEQLCGLFEQRASNPGPLRDASSPTHIAPRDHPAPDHLARPTLIIAGETHVQHQAQP